MSIVKYFDTYTPNSSIIIDYGTIQHVFADTLRSIAVVIASIIAELVDSVTPEVADATAAVIVSVIILVSLLPLFRGLFHTWRELRSITREEQSLLDDESNTDIEGEIS